MILDATTKKIQVLLDGAAATTEAPIVASYVDVTTTAFTPGAADTVTTGATAVDVVAAPAASTQRQVKYISVYNADTTAIVVTVRYNDNSTLRIMVKVTLAIGNSLIYSQEGGWQIIQNLGSARAMLLVVPGDPSGTGVTIRFIARTAGTISAIKSTARVAPTGTYTYDINKNGTTLYTTQGNRPTRTAAAAITAVTHTLPDVTAFVTGDIFEVDIDTANTSIQDVTFFIEY